MLSYFSATCFLLCGSSLVWSLGKKGKRSTFSTDTPGEIECSGWSDRIRLFHCQFTEIRSVFGAVETQRLLHRGRSSHSCFTSGGILDSSFHPLLQIWKPVLKGSTIQGAHAFCAREGMCVSGCLPSFWHGAMDMQKIIMYSSPSVSCLATSEIESS